MQLITAFTRGIGFGYCNGGTAQHLHLQKKIIEANPLREISCILMQRCMADVDEEWQLFLNGSTVGKEGEECDDGHIPLLTSIKDDKIPKCGDIYISTKTKISYLNRPIELANTFWRVPIMPYITPKEGIVKKQMKFNCFSEEQLAQLLEKTKTETFLDNHIISKFGDSTGRVKYRDVRKISVGLCKKDVISHRSKEKSAFYNCFVMILRVLVDDRFREVHVKVFNTGKLEIPGIQSDVHA